ncbi:MAG TPA: DUF1874 domain-containing protein [Casimicrobiaceae bacterium]|nr:DUF1874 domain-containing protein [Casimicrobiaceae bacterium]
MYFVLNAPVLTAFGDYRFEGPLALDEARAFALRGVRSAVGHAATADFLSEILGIDIPWNREAICMQPGDQALVLRLVDRLPEASILGAEALRSTPHEFGVLKRLR